MLPTQLQNAHIIIHRLDQPHRFDFALHCKCGFQHHGFLSDTSKGDAENADMIKSAQVHLINKHAASPAKVNELIEVVPFTHVGGADHFILSQMLVQHREKEQEAAKLAQGKSTEMGAGEEKKETVAQKPVEQPPMPTQTAASVAVKKIIAAAAPKK